MNAQTSSLVFVVTVIPPHFSSDAFKMIFWHPPMITWASRVSVQPGDWDVQHGSTVLDRRWRRLHRQRSLGDAQARDPQGESIPQPLPEQCEVEGVKGTKKKL